PAHAAVRAEAGSTASTAAAVAYRTGEGTAGTDGVRLCAAHRCDHGDLVVAAPRQAPAHRARPGMGRPLVPAHRPGRLRPDRPRQNGPLRLERPGVLPPLPGPDPRSEHGAADRPGQR